MKPPVARPGLAPCALPLLAMAFAARPCAGSRVLRRRSVGASDFEHSQGGGSRAVADSALWGADSASGASDQSGQAGAAQELVGELVEQLLASDSMAIMDIVRVARNMHLRDALPKLETKLPTEILTLAHMSANGTKVEGQFSEASLAKARVYMNNMMYDAWEQLDAVMIECKQFEESNRDTFGQVVTDLDHIGADLGDRERMKVEAEGGIADMSLRIKETSELRDNLKRSFETIRAQNEYELRLREDDQAVFDAVLNMTRCPPGGKDDGYGLIQWQVCNTSEGVSLHTGDPEVMAKLKRAPRAERALLDALGAGAPPGAVAAASLLQEGGLVGAAGRQAPPPVPVSKEPPSDSQWKKCRTPQSVDCGFLHDTMALQWGRFRDLVDELTTEMERSSDAFVRERDNLNEQITTFRASKTKHQEMLGEAVSEMNSLSAESREKEQQHRDLEASYKKKMKECHDHVTEILFTNICSVRVVRNKLMEYSQETPPEKIKDCDFTDLSPRMCSVDCDDSCPADVGGANGQSCGGTQDLVRELLVSPSPVGMPCPPLSRAKRCNQHRCPVACSMSQWSGYSGCSKECGGGTQGRTRAILVKPRNGGNECDTTMEERSCNTGSCDRDCTLFEWTAWEPCSMACGGGLQKRERHVDLPIRANGKCPGPQHADRLQMQACNTQKCVGDEICIARQDLVIAVDGSGSVKKKGFDILKSFARNLTSRYRAVYYGQEDMRVGLILYGNGVLFKEGYVSEAIQAHRLSTDLASVTQAIDRMQWQRGFTNMMQAFKLADKMFEAEGRSDAQSAILMLSDGKYTNAFRTSQKVQNLKDKGIQIFMAPVSTYAGQSLEQIRDWASSPWESNYVRIPGIEALENNEDVFAQQLLVKFCPRAFSPSLEAASDAEVGFLKIHDEGYPTEECGSKGHVGYKETLEECFLAVKNLGVLAFAYEAGGRSAGTCYSEAINVTQEVWDDALANRTSPACPSGGWEFSYYASTFIINPAVLTYASLEPGEDEQV